MSYELIQIDQSQLGPAMQACTPLQQRFVIALLELGDNNFTRAAAMAGSTAKAEGLRVVAHQLAHHPKVLEAIHEEAIARLASAKVLAVSKLIDAMNTAPEWKDKLKAIDMLLNRAGMHTISETRVSGEVKHLHSNEDAIAQIEDLAGRLGVDPKKLIGFAYEKPQETVDAEFTEHDAAGLEDVL